MTAIPNISDKQRKQLNKAFPSVAYMEKAAEQRVPRFVLDYLKNGLGDGMAVKRNRELLKNVQLLPKFLSEHDQPSLKTTLLGKEYDAPFGVSPVGMASLVWPCAEAYLAAAAKAHNIPFSLSMAASITLENCKEIAPENAWFQLFAPEEDELVDDIVRRCVDSGYETLIVTVDSPFPSHREHDIHNGFSVPPNFGLKNLVQMLQRPGWLRQIIRKGIPQFANIKPYLDAAQDGDSKPYVRESTQFMVDKIGLHMTAERFARIRKIWPGKLLAKGVLCPLEAKRYVELGADGVVVSNHGGRNFDASPATVTMLPLMRQQLGAQVPIIVDSGVRSGLDVARMMALGADFVLMGRPYIYAVAAMGEVGADHVMNILKTEFQCALGLLGCETPRDLPSHLFDPQQSLALAQPFSPHGNLPTEAANDEPSSVKEEIATKTTNKTAVQSQ